VGDIVADHGPMAVGALCGKGVSWFTAAESAGAVFAEARSIEGASWSAAHQEEQRVQAELLRCIFGNPFRPVRLDPAFLPPIVATLARAGYEERLPNGDLDPERLTVLADALEEHGAAGELVEHLRSTRRHVRGCHVLDLILRQTGS
jgi:hypothetical protein